MKKKIMSVLLSTAMVASMLAGCGSNGTADNTSADKQLQKLQHRRVRLQKKAGVRQRETGI